MEQNEFTDLLILQKRKCAKLNEILDLTRQMAEVLSRNDNVSMRLMMSMRQEPIQRLKEIKRCEETGKAHMSSRAAALLDGKPAREQKEKALADQVAANRRLADKIIELDERINRKVGGKKSCYETK